MELLSQFTQQEYGLASALVIGLVVLGLLAVCIPRPRKNVVEDESSKKKKNKKRR